MQCAKKSPAFVAIITLKNMPLYRQMHQGVADYAARQTGWRLEFIYHNSPRMRTLTPGVFGGIILTSPFRDALQLIRGWPTPQVCISGSRSGRPSKYRFPVIQTDNAAITRMAAEHLWRQGCRRLVFYCMPAALADGTGWHDERRAAFLECAQKYGAADGTAFCGPANIRPPDDAFAITLKWLRQLPLPIGIMAANDEHARMLLDACGELKLEVPRQVAVIGVDNDEFICNFTVPPLTSVIQNAERSGFEAARLLDAQLQGQPVEKYMLMPPRGVAIRQSTDRLAVSDPVMRKAMDFIRRDAPGPNISAADVAARAGVSRATLNKQARRLTGQTIHAIIATERLRRAQALLENTSLPMKQVAGQAGFSSVQYMHNIFKKQTGGSPGDWRRQASLR